MGAVNYGTSNYITLGYNLNWNSSDFENWEDVKHTPTWTQYERENYWQEVKRCI